MRYLFLVLVSMTIPLTTMNMADAAESYKGKVLGIIIEKSCLISDRCVDYKDIVSYDNSIPEYSGKLVEKNGDLIRKASSYQNNIRYYQYVKNFTIMIDPPQHYQTHIQTITIVSQLDEFHIKGQFSVLEYKSTNDAKATDKIRSYSHTRYVDSGCMNAIITARNWQSVLADTIQYLKSNCDPTQTKLKTVTTESTPLTKHDIKTSYKWQYDTKLEQIKKECLKARNSCSLSIS